jgi:hypothetical protein
LCGSRKLQLEQLRYRTSELDLNRPREFEWLCVGGEPGSPLNFCPNIHCGNRKSKHKTLVRCGYYSTTSFEGKCTFSIELRDTIKLQENGCDPNRIFVSY